MGGAAELYREVCELVYREAMLLDRRRWDEWIALYTEDAVYWVPAWASEEETTDDPDSQLNLIYIVNRGRLEDRVLRIEARDSYASVPLDRTVHVVSNVLVEKLEGDHLEATANCLIHVYGRGGGALAIARKKITFIDDRLEGPIDIYHL